MPGQTTDEAPTKRLTRLSYADERVFYGLFAVEGVAVGGAFDRDTPTRRNADGAPRRRSVSVPGIVIYRQEVGPVYAVSAVGALLQCTIARLG
jgi:hypothetical protein